MAAVAVQAASQLLNGFSQARADSYSAQVAANNAKLAQQKEAYVAAAGAAQAEQAGLRARSKLADVRAGLAANNLDVNSGSAAEVQVGQRELGALDQANVVGNAAVEAYGFRTQYVSDEAQSKLYKRKAVGDIIGSVLGSAGKVAAGSDIIPNGAGGGGSGGGGLGDLNKLDPTLMESGSDVPDDYAWMQETGAYGIGG